MCLRAQHVPVLPTFPAFVGWPWTHSICVECCESTPESLGVHLVRLQRLMQLPGRRAAAVALDGAEHADGEAVLELGDDAVQVGAQILGQLKRGGLRYPWGCAAIDTNRSTSDRTISGEC